VIPITNFFIKEIKGTENIPKEEAFVIASNHINGLDYWFIGTVLKQRMKDLRFVAAMDSLKITLQSGILYYLSNAIVVNRKKKEREIVLEKISGVLKEKKIVVIFPEGDTNSKKVLLKGKTGIAELALRENIKIVPFGMRTAKNSFKRIIEIGKPLSFSKEPLKKIEKNQKEYYILLRQITDKIMKEISKLCKKPYPYED